MNSITKLCRFCSQYGFQIKIDVEHFISGTNNPFWLNVETWDRAKQIFGKQGNDVEVMAEELLKELSSKVKDAMDE